MGFGAFGSMVRMASISSMRRRNSLYRSNSYSSSRSITNRRIALQQQQNKRRKSINKTKENHYKRRDNMIGKFLFNEETGFQLIVDTITSYPSFYVLINLKNGKTDTIPMDSIKQLVDIEETFFMTNLKSLIGILSK